MLLPQPVKWGVNMNFINIIDLYGYGIFDEIVLPDGIDHDLLINSIIDKCGLSTPLYTDEILLTQKINIFFLKNAHTFERLYNAYMAEYNPIHNYDRYESITNKNQRSGNDVVKVSPYDTDNFINDSSTDRAESIDNEHTAHIYGNIGVTTSAQMLDQELSLLPRLNFYNVVSNLFYDEFCIKVM